MGGFGKASEDVARGCARVSPDRTGTIGFFTVKYVGGKVRFINQITGFHEVILHIKSRNPMVVLKGC
jgi:hypothetical protein